MNMKLRYKLQMCLGQWSLNYGNSEIQYVFVQS